MPTTNENVENLPSGEEAIQELEEFFADALQVVVQIHNTLILQANEGEHETLVYPRKYIQDVLLSLTSLAKPLASVAGKQVQEIPRDADKDTQ